METKTPVDLVMVAPVADRVSTRGAPACHAPPSLLCLLSVLAPTATVYSTCTVHNPENPLATKIYYLKSEP